MLLHLYLLVSMCAYEAQIVSYSGPKSQMFICISFLQASFLFTTSPILILPSLWLSKRTSEHLLWFSAGFLPKVISISEKCKQEVHYLEFGIQAIFKAFDSE